MRLSHHYVIPHISTGDMLRGEIKAGTSLGVEARRHMDEGDLIPDDVVLSMVVKRLDQDDTRTRGFVLDGFPRTVAQAEGLDDLLRPAVLDLSINIVVPTQLVLRRLASRRICEDCGTIYSTMAPPRVAWICDVCGGEVVHREDDTEAAIHRRLDLYEQETAPLISWYRRAGTLVSVSGVGSPDAVSDRLVAAIDDHRRAGGFGPPLPAGEGPRASGPGGEDQAGGGYVGGDETGGDETGGDETGGDETGDETGGAYPGGVYTGDADIVGGSGIARGLVDGRAGGPALGFPDDAFPRGQAVAE